MRYSRVRIAAVCAELPPRAVTSLEIERRLGAVYARLGLVEGRLELMSGIRERRFWPPGTPPSEVAARAGAAALARGEALGIARARVGCVIHASVCRDFIEPATANLVHHALGLEPTALVFDLSNACLGVLDAMVVIADQIEAGRIDAGLAVAGECGEALVESTIAALERDPSLTRQSIKDSVASLTIGSSAAAVLLAAADVAPAAPIALAGGSARCATSHHALCRGTTDTGLAGEASVLMATKSEALLEAGCALAGETWRDFLPELGWTVDMVDRVFCHQVGSAHRKRLLETIGVDPARDSPTYETLGNTGAAALPVALARGLDAGRFVPGQRAALLGIGSGINCLMLGLEWPTR